VTEPPPSPAAVAGRRETFRQRRRFAYRVARPWRNVPHAEAIEALERSHRGRQRVRRDLVANVLNLLYTLQRWANDNHSGEGSTSYLALAQALYDEDATWQDAYRDAKSIYRWARRGELAGLLRISEHRDESTGAILGLRWQLLDPELHCQAASRSSSAGGASGIWRRRGECRKERHARRVAPWRRRAGRAGTARWVRCRSAAPRIFFGRQDLPSKRLSCSSSSPTLRDGRVGAHVRGAAGAVNGNGNGSSEDRRAIPPPFRVAVSRLRRAAKAAAPSGVVQSASALHGGREARLEWLADRAEQGADPRAVVFAAFEEWHGRRAWLNRLRWTQLANALRLADRVADFGAGRRGAGAAFVIDCMLFPYTERRIWADPGRPGKRFDEPGSLCLYVDELRHAARRWHRGARSRAAAC
jgi:hypothetical protein